MAKRLSVGLKNYLLANGSLKHALQGGKLLIYSGSQPATADAAPTGTLLCTLTASSGAHTAEVQATGTVTITGSSGSVNTITVDSVDILPAAVSYDTSTTVTAAAVAAAINKASTSPKYTATSASNVVTITAARGAGAEANTLVVSGSATTLSLSYADLSGGVTAVNGLSFGAPSAGALSKDSAQTWSGVNAATGTAGWFRFVGAVADSGAADSAETEVRFDGSIGTSGADMNLNSVVLTSGVTTEITAGSFSLPTT